VVVATERQISADLEGEVVILNFDEGVYYGLDKVGAHVWDRLSDPVSVNELIEHVQAEFDVSAEQLQADLSGLLRDMREAGLVEISGPSRAGDEAA